MKMIKRPLRLFGENRPAKLLDTQLKSVRVTAVVCVALIGLVLIALYILNPGTLVGFILRAAVLFFAVLPGILLEYFVGRNKIHEAGWLTASKPENLYGAELLQFVFVVMLGIFVIQGV